MSAAGVGLYVQVRIDVSSTRDRYHNRVAGSHHAEPSNSSSVRRTWVNRFVENGTTGKEARIIDRSFTAVRCGTVARSATKSHHDTERRRQIAVDDDDDDDGPVPG